MARHNIAVFASGSGTNAEQLIKHFSDNPLGEVTVIVCNKEGVGVLDRAKQLGVEVIMIDREGFFNSEKLLAELNLRNIDFIALAGFLWLIPDYLTQAYAARIVNLHPALLPKYGGKGMYGQRVHEAVLAAGDTETGITVHHVNEHFDEGEIIFQATCEVLPNDTPDTLAERIHRLEHEHYPKVVEKILSE